MVLVVTGEPTSTLDLAPSELGEALSSMRLCPPQAQQEMQLSLSRLGQLTPVQAYRVGARLELFDGLKRLPLRDVWPTRPSWHVQRENAGGQMTAALGAWKPHADPHTSPEAWGFASP
jgi:hypothetical protein